MRVELINHPTHSPEQVREIISEAVEIADTQMARGVSREAIFVEACRLLGQRITGAGAAPDAVDLIAAGIVRNGA